MNGCLSASSTGSAHPWIPGTTSASSRPHGITTSLSGAARCRIRVLRPISFSIGHQIAIAIPTPSTIAAAATRITEFRNSARATTHTSNADPRA